MMNTQLNHQADSWSVDVFATCDTCGDEKSVTVDLRTWQSWMNEGTNVQDAFPDMTPANREVLIGNKARWHLCNVCWSDLSDDMEG
jgi:hypothetical protein